MLLSGCSGNSGSGSSSGISITVSPTSATVATSSTQQFTAKVQNTSDTSVTWKVNGIAWGNDTYGRISGTGLYTAPASVPSSATVTITAISAADVNKTADAAVTIVLRVTVSPSAASVEVTKTQQFTAAVSFSTNTRVTWQVNGVAGGNSAVGTIDSNGLYTAPSSVPAPSAVTVAAVASADSSRSASATVTVTPPPIVISPIDAVLGAGARQSYTATVLSSTIHPAWGVSCSSARAGACGSITSDGTYTTPSTPPPHGTVSISASMPDGSASTESVTATIQFGNATLAGRYVFTIADEIDHTMPSQTGTLMFDGEGNISGGTIDSTKLPGTPISVTGGTYQVGTDGRGTATVQIPGSSLGLQFVLSSNAQGFVVCTDQTANQAAGTIDLQQVSSGERALEGTYALSVTGVTIGESAVLQQEAGSIAFDRTGAISAGVIDLNTDSTFHTAKVTTGSFTAPSEDGRGTLTFTTPNGTQTFAYYPVDSKHAKVVAIDGTFAGVGDLFLQPQGPFSNSALKGRYVFSVKGESAGMPFGVVGVFSLDGSGNVKDLQFDGITQTVFDVDSGAYVVTDSLTGRTTATWTGNGGSRLEYVLYPRSDGGMVLLQRDSVYAGTGEAVPQTDASVLSFLALQGAFAFRFGGIDLSSGSAADRVIGHMSATSSTTLFGTADGGSTGQGTELTLNLLSQVLGPQRYVFGISSVTLGGGPIVLYRIDDDRAFMIESDETRRFTGALQRQY